MWGYASPCLCTTSKIPPPRPWLHPHRSTGGCGAGMMQKAVPAVMEALLNFFSPPLFSQQYQAPSLSFVSKRATNRVCFFFTRYSREETITAEMLPLCAASGWDVFVASFLASRMLLLLLLSPAGGPACWGRSVALSPPMFSDGNRGVVMRACTVYPHNVKGAAAAAAAVFFRTSIR